MMVGRPVVLEYERVECKPGKERLVLGVSALVIRVTWA